MKTHLLISFILIGTLFFGFKPLTNPVFISGHIKRNPKDTSAYVEHLFLTVKGDHKILANTMTDKKGNFNVTFIPKDEKSFDFFCSGVAIDTLLIGSVKTFQSDTPDLTFYIPAQTKKNFLGRQVCPKCSKADQVYKITYGDGMPLHKRYISDNGDTSYQTIVKGKYYAGTCIVGVATFYCNRDKVRF